METWNFKVNNDNNINLVLDGKLTSIVFLDSEKSTKLGDEVVLAFDNEKQACIVRVVKVLVTSFKDIKSNYLDYPFASEDIVKVVTFEVIRDLVQERMDEAKKIVAANPSIFGDYSEISEINAGFNNSIFNVDNKYVIKICSDINKEDLFDVEANYYQEHDNSKIIPKLYKYDKSKMVVPFVYEIIECVNGKSVYYYWYKMTEEQRELFIKKLMDLIKDIHKIKCEPYDWSKYIKEEVVEYLNQSKDLLSEDEYSLVMSSLNYYDLVLKSNYFTLVHNDLHFDNILISDDNTIKLIDFNDAMVAPIDFDLRLLYMCVGVPWKWANTEMDPYQVPEDYVHLFEYVKKYYPELNDIPYLDERMIIYTVLDYITLLPRFKTDELKFKVLDNSRELINRLS